MSKKLSARQAGYENFVAKTVQTAEKSGAAKAKPANEEVKYLLLSRARTIGLLTLVQQDGTIVLAKRKAVS